jgi:hypothetical protein
MSVTPSMKLRIHSYSRAPDYDFDFEYKQGGNWLSLKDRVIATEPIRVTRGDREFATCALVLDNTDGGLTPENVDSEYNGGGMGWDPLIDEARPVRLKQGINCYANIADGITVTSTVAPTGGNLSVLTNGVYGDVWGSTPSEWVYWTALGSGAQVTLTIDLGSTQMVWHGAASFLSQSDDGIWLPATVEWQYSIDGATWHDCAPAAFDMAEYAQSGTASRFVAWFTDLGKPARYVRAVIINIAAVTQLQIDEIEIFGGDETVFDYVESLKGYLGEDAQVDTGAGRIPIRFLDETKKEEDNREVVLTAEYTQQRPEQIIYDLLTNASYWTGAAGAYDGPVAAGDIGWDAVDDLSGFVVTKWHGQQNTIRGYIDEVAQLIGWRYDCDGDGVRQFWAPAWHAAVADDYMSFFGERWGRRGTFVRTKTGRDIRNKIELVWREGGLGAEVHRTFQHRGSVARYGARYGRWTEPVVTSLEVAEQLAQSLLAEFAYSRDGASVGIQGDFDIQRPCGICSFKEPIRAWVDKGDLWRVESVETEMITDGRGRFTAQVEVRDYVSNPTRPVANVAAASNANSITVSWDAAANARGYCVYWASGNDPDAWTFTRRNKVSATSDTIPGLSAGDYWIYVTSINDDGVESENSAIITCPVPVHGTASGDEEDTWGWSDLLLMLGDCDANDVSAWAQHQWPSIVDADDAIVELLGPSTVIPPTNVTQTVPVKPVSGWTNEYLRYRADLFAGSTSVRWRWRIAAVAIDTAGYGRMWFHFGSPLYSGVVSLVWP